MSSSSGPSSRSAMRAASGSCSSRLPAARRASTASPSPSPPATARPCSASRSSRSYSLRPGSIRYAASSVSNAGTTPASASAPPNGLKLWATIGLPPPASAGVAVALADQQRLAAARDAEQPVAVAGQADGAAIGEQRAERRRRRRARRRARAPRARSRHRGRLPRARRCGAAARGTRSGGTAPPWSPGRADRPAPARGRRRARGRARWSPAAWSAPRASRCSISVWRRFSPGTASTFA